MTELKLMRINWILSELYFIPKRKISLWEKIQILLLLPTWGSFNFSRHELFDHILYTYMYVVSAEMSWRRAQSVWVWQLWGSEEQRTASCVLSNFLFHQQNFPASFQGCWSILWERSLPHLFKSKLSSLAAGLHFIFDNLCLAQDEVLHKIHSR